MLSRPLQNDRNGFAHNFNAHWYYDRTLSGEVIDLARLRRINVGGETPNERA